MFWRRYGIKGRNRTLKLSLRVFLLVFIMYCIVSLSQAQKPKAVIVVLCRNSDLVDIRSSMRELEARFNHKFQYPYVFLNNEPFTQDFMDGTLEMTESLVEYGQIPPSHWEVPRWINQSLAQESYQLLNNRSVSYWNSTTYRQMCRYFSGFFFRHELLDKYDYYWRLEPGVHFYCDIDDDPFMILERERKDYGYAIVMPEEMPTIESLVDHALDWDSKQPKKAHPMLPFFVQN
ncbi:glycosyl transferase, partial [Gorgonomyces haynaldii]